MASPVADTYSVTSGVAVFAGRYPSGLLYGGASLGALAAAGGLGVQESSLAGAAAVSGLSADGGLQGLVLPSWYTSAATGEWVALSSSTLTSSGVGWPTNPAPGVGGPYTKIVGAWGGGILNTVGVHYGGSFIPGTFLVIWGGGHADWAGNDMYAYGPIESDSAVWRRLMDPTDPPPSNVLRDSNGYPAARHTYDTLVHLPDSNEMLTFGTPGVYVSGNSLVGSDLFDFSVDPASANPWSENDTGFPAYTGGATINGNFVYNPVTKKAWGVGNGNGSKLAVWDDVAKTWASYYKDNPYNPGGSKAAIDPVHNLFVFIDSRGYVAVQDLANPNSAIYYPTFTGTAPSYARRMLDWDAAGGRFVSWDSSGKTVYFLTPGANPASGGDDWVWTSTTPAGGATPADGEVEGTYGRFRMVNGPMRGILLMSKADSAITFYKM